MVRKRLSFSLRSLILLVMLIASGMGLWWRWEPWICIGPAPEKPKETVKSKPEVDGTLSPDAKTYIRGEDGKYSLYKVENNELLTTCDGQLHFLGSGKQCIYIDDRCALHLIDAHSGRELNHFCPFAEQNNNISLERFEGHPLVRILAYPQVRCGDSDQYVLAIRMGIPYLVDLRSENVVLQLPRVPHAAAIDEIQFSPDGRRFYTMGVQPSGWDIQNRLQLFQLEVRSGYYFVPSPDWSRIIFDIDYEDPLVPSFESPYYSRDLLMIDAISGKHILEFNGIDIEFASEDCIILIPSLLSKKKTAIVWYRLRPEYWWGIAWLPEFWLTVVFSMALGWSLCRDRKHGVAKPANQP